MATHYDSEDEFYKLVQKGFYVEPPTHPIDLNTVPTNGSEFIHKSRLEDSKLKFSLTGCENAVSPDTKKSMRHWGRVQAKEFSDYAMKLVGAKAQLKKKFPKKLPIPDENGKEWCTFCLGSKSCFEIYGGERDNDKEGHLPVLSIVLHLSQKDIKMVLEYLFHWFENLGMDNAIAVWLYALLACLEKPVDEDFEGILEDLYDNIKERIKTRNESEKFQLYLISAILSQYFCVKSYKIGPSLEKFMALSLNNYY